MKLRTIMRTSGLVAAGAAAAILFVACSTTTRDPDSASGTGAGPAPQGTGDAARQAADAEGERAGLESERAAAAERSRLRAEEIARRRISAQAVRGQPAGNEETVIVTGSRIVGDDFTSAVAAAAGADSGRFAAQRSPLTRVSPGEEGWIISQPAVSDAVSEVAEDALGPGAMIARVVPAVVRDDEAAAVTEIPLPLKHTDVDARIEGYVGTVAVTQQFENPYDEKIEAVYMFPLPEKAAVSEFVMTIGERRIRGILREKEEAEAIYRQARAQGYQASLLTQHRPNVFEQKVANIEPGKRIDVDITYYETLAYADGWYSFVFPTVVGPRYNPPGSTDPLQASDELSADAGCRRPLPDARHDERP